MREFLEKEPDDELDRIYYFNLVNGMLDFDLNNNQRDLIERDIAAYGNARLKYWTEHQEEYRINPSLLNAIRKDIWFQNTVGRLKRIKHFLFK